jgi:molybdate transport system substrate-binding protein
MMSSHTIIHKGMRVLKPLVSTFLIFSFVLSGCGTPGTRIPLAIATDTVANTSVILDHTLSTPQTRTITIFAAASLTDAFLEIGMAFEADHPGVRVNISFAGSQVLRTQIEQGAAADLFASADHNNMDILIKDNLVALNSYQDFTTNKLVVILPSGNPAGVKSIENLAEPNLKLVLADQSVPAGSYARQILLNMSKDPAYGVGFSSAVEANVVSNETDVRQVVTKVELGEADAGIVYVSDVYAVPDLVSIHIPEKFNIIARYPIAILMNSPNPDLAAEFISFVMSLDGQAIMEKWGFTQTQ